MILFIYYFNNNNNNKRHKKKKKKNPIYKGKQMESNDNIRNKKKEKRTLDGKSICLWGEKWIVDSSCLK